MPDMTTAYIGFGSNLGDRNGSINKAIKMLSQTEGIEVYAVSDVLETSPLGGCDQPEYLNAVAQLNTTLNAEELHHKMADIETALGRTKGQKWEPRTIDLDLLLFGDKVINTPELKVPHPQMHLRCFVLKGLSQLNPELLHPLMKRTVGELAARLGGKDFVIDPASVQLVSLAGIIGVGKTTLAKKISDALGGKLLLEPYDTNPFMPQVYAGKKELALDSQMYFLTQRTSQLNADILKAGQIVITDYVFDKELIYARRLLNTNQLSLYLEIYPSFAAKVVPPVLVIYLTDNAKNCLERIRSRNRPYEQKIQKNFLEDLSKDYEHLFAGWNRCPVVRISMSGFDAGRNTDVQHLIEQVKSYVAI